MDLTVCPTIVAKKSVLTLVNSSRCSPTSLRSTRLNSSEGTRGVQEVGTDNSVSLLLLKVSLWHLIFSLLNLNEDKKQQKLHTKCTGIYISSKNKHPWCYSITGCQWTFCLLMKPQCMLVEWYQSSGLTTSRAFVEGDIDM